MSYGFSVFGSSGVATLTSSDLTFSLIDLFSVAQSSSGSRTYPNLAGRSVVVAQSAIEPTTIDFASLFSLNTITVTTYDSGSDKVVAWSPGTQYLNSYNVQLYVFGY